MIKAIFFDMDGTLVDSEKHYTTGTYNWMRENGYTGTLSELFCIVGKTMEETYEICAKLINITPLRAKELNTEYFTKNLIDYSQYIYEDTIKTLKELKEMGLKVLICSQSNNSEVSKCISDMKIGPYIDKYICSDDLDKPKPDPDIYLKALKYLGINKDEAIIVEDSETGIESGISSGIYTIAKKDTVYGLKQARADKIIEKLYDVVSYVKNKNGK